MKENAAEIYTQPISYAISGEKPDTCCIETLSPDTNNGIRCDIDDDEVTGDKGSYTLNDAGIERLRDFYAISYSHVDSLRFQATTLEAFNVMLNKL